MPFIVAAYSEKGSCSNHAPVRPSPAAAQAAAVAQAGEPSAQSAPSPPMPGLSGPGTIAPSSVPAVLDDAERGSISGNTYQNDLLNFSYEFPRGWIAATLETLHGVNARVAASMTARLLKQHPESGGSMRILFPKVVFYASRSGMGDGRRMSFPCVRITILPWNRRRPTLDSVREMGVAMKGSDLSLVGEPEENSAGGRDFIRANYAFTGREPQGLLSRFEGVVNGELLMLEFLAANKQELDELASTTNSLSFR